MLLWRDKGKVRERETNDDTLAIIQVHFPWGETVQTYIRISQQNITPKEISLICHKIRAENISVGIANTIPFIPVFILNT